VKPTAPSDRTDAVTTPKPRAATTALPLTAYVAPLIRGRPFM
jgi:hypothetical protein